MSYAGSPSDQQRFLRITEIMYNPTEGGDFDNEEYESALSKKMTFNLVL
jgi:hypothetical protein